MLKGYFFEDGMFFVQIKGSKTSISGQCFLLEPCTQRSSVIWEVFPSRVVFFLKKIKPQGQTYLFYLFCIVHRNEKLYARVVSNSCRKFDSSMECMSPWGRMNSFLPQRWVKQFLTIKQWEEKNKYPNNYDADCNQSDLNLSSSSLGIRVNRVYPKPSMFLDSLLLSLWFFPVSEDHHFYWLLILCEA